MIKKNFLETTKSKGINFHKYFSKKIKRLNNKLKKLYKSIYKI